MLLVDTSVWIEVLRKPKSLELESVVDLDEVVTCLPVIQEVLRGFLDERAFRVGSGADCLITACAIRHGLPILDCDRDFSLLAQVSPLRGRKISMSSTADSAG